MCYANKLQRSVYDWLALPRQSFLTKKPVSRTASVVLYTKITMQKVIAQTKQTMKHYQNGNC